MNILITGSDGFIGKNLFYKLSEYNKFNILTINKKTSRKRMESNLLNADIIFHLAGINKEMLPQYNYENNFNFTNDICCFLKKNKKNTKIIYASTTQVKLNNVYGKSKLKAEKILLNYKKKTNADLIIYRLPNVFGKWSKPSYNSVVSTFCYNISRKKNIIVTEPNKKIKLLYIDDLLNSFLSNIKNKKKDIFIKIKNTYTLSLLELSKLIKSFYLNEKNYLLTNISNPFIKKIYSTYLSFVSKSNFYYELQKHNDKRGFFAEFLKNKNFGQFSFFSILPKKIRGNHYHNTKIEKFIVISGKVKFSFFNIKNKRFFSIIGSEDKSLVVNTVPGWAHNIENIGDKVSIILVWSNEIFDKDKPDTVNYIIPKK